MTALLLRLGAPIREGSVRLGAITLTVVAAAPGGLDRLEVGEPLPDPDGQPEPEPGPRLAALGWATVDAARLAETLGKSVADEAHEDPALGAIGYGLASASLPLVLLEPASEGRLAAALARLGEGPVALYLDGTRPGPDLGATPVARTGAGRDGRLLRPPRPWGPFLIALDA